MENIKRNPQTTGRQIAYQSSLKLVMKWSKQCGNCISLRQLCGVASVITDIVEYGYDKDKMGPILDAIEKAIEKDNNKGE